MPPDAPLQLPAQLPSVPTHQHLPSLLPCPRRLGLRFYLRATQRKPCSLCPACSLLPSWPRAAFSPCRVVSAGSQSPFAPCLLPQTSCGEGAECSWGQQGALGNGAALDVTSPSWIFPATNKIQAEDTHLSCFR